jgi:hypothetical protein
VRRGDLYPHQQRLDTSRLICSRLPISLDFDRDDVPTEGWQFAVEVIGACAWMVANSTGMGFGRLDQFPRSKIRRPRCSSAARAA